MLSDLVPEILATEFRPRRPLTNTEKCARWREKHRVAWNAYRRDWYAKRKVA